MSTTTSALVHHIFFTHFHVEAWVSAFDLSLISMLTHTALDCGALVVSAVHFLLFSVVLPWLIPLRLVAVSLLCRSAVVYRPLPYVGGMKESLATHF